MTSIDSFIAVGNYLAAPILIGAGLTISGLMTWSEAGKKTKRDRPIVKLLTVLGSSILAGASELYLVVGIDPIFDSTSIQSWLEFYLSSLILLLHLTVPLVLSAILPARNESLLLSQTLRSSYLLLSGLLISITATLNFGLSVLLSLYLSSSLLFATRYPLRSITRRRSQQLMLACFTPGGIWGLWRVVAKEKAEEWLRVLIGDWKVGGGWSLPIAMVFVTPLQLLLATSVVL